MEPIQAQPAATPTTSPRQMTQEEVAIKDVAHRIMEIANFFIRMLENKVWTNMSVTYANFTTLDHQLWELKSRASTLKQDLRLKKNGLTTDLFQTTVRTQYDCALEMISKEYYRLSVKDLPEIFYKKSSEMLSSIDKLTR